MHATWAWVLATCLATTSGCGTLQLDDKWSPLRRVEAVDDVPRGVAWTVGDTVYVSGILDFEVTWPPGSVARDALLEHERLHAMQQFSFAGNPGGPLGWHERCRHDPAFRLAQEQGGWALELRTRLAGGAPVDVEWTARFLSGERYGFMWTYEAALAWVKQVCGVRP